MTWKKAILPDDQLEGGLVASMLQTAPKPEPEPTPALVDLSTCVPGQKLRCRDGYLAKFVGPSDSFYYPYECERYYGASPRTNLLTYRQDGVFFSGGSTSVTDNDPDIVEILPLDTPVASPGQLQHGAQGEKPLQPGTILTDSSQPTPLTDKEIEDVARKAFTEVLDQLVERESAPADKPLWELMDAAWEVEQNNRTVVGIMIETVRDFLFPDAHESECDSDWNSDYWQCRQDLYKQLTAQARIAMGEHA